MREKPEEYACIGCDLKVSDHETLFETRKQRAERGALVDERYVPLQDCPELQQEVFKECISPDDISNGYDSRSFMRIRPAGSSERAMHGTTDTARRITAGARANACSGASSGFGATRSKSSAKSGSGSSGEKKPSTRYSPLTDERGGDAK